MRRVRFHKKNEVSEEPIDTVERKIDLDTESDNHEEIKTMLCEKLNINEEEVEIISFI
ncbi:hypothetical protein [Salimicrobium halophilum]|uniref:Uncharacterized protein n=1 Tax=Salimicrobium halophilum TaxID=86666 RepID=A0A1G8UD07_9BACI|nr:hypothetical protein [Salimicrobium halophilum]SDJ51484.1 hypothetical protein SAMN04490247_2177 [Salimicrobium halophilum]